jgi:hypothetical protein
LSLSDCEEQLRTWASNQAEKEIERRPEGARLRQLKELEQKAIGYCHGKQEHQDESGYCCTK